MIEIDEGVGWPQKAAEVVASYEFTGVIDEVDKDAERLFTKSHAGAAAAQFGIARIDLEDAETPDTGLILEGFQGTIPLT